MNREVGVLGVVGFLLFVAQPVAGVGAPQDEAMPPVLRMAFEAAIAPAEYALVPGAPAADGRPRWTAENPAHGLRATFGDTGVRIGRAAAPEPPEIVVDGARLEYRRGPLTEWYVNAADGLEQGFTIAEPPPQGTASDAVELCMAFGGTVVPRMDDDCRGLTLLDAQGVTHLSYARLAAWDAAGRELPAWLDGREAGAVAILVRVEGATWPIVIDPVIATQEAKLVAADAAAGDHFGCCVSLSGKTALVGAYRDDLAGGSHAGSAYVFVRSGTSWTRQSKLIPTNAAAYDEFGSSVSLSGDTALVGARYDDHAGGTDAGSAYVFVRSGTSWTQQDKLVAADAAAYDEFGSSVSLSGDTALVGAEWDDHAGLTEAGSAYVFVRNGTTWSQQAKLVATDAAMLDYFGNSVSLSGDTALVAAQVDNHAGGTDAGSAYVFVRSGTTWTQQAKLVAADAAAYDVFGCSVSLSADTALVGAYVDDHAGGSNAGSAYVFVRSGTTWTQQAKLIATDPATSDLLGHSVSLSGDTALLAADGDDHAGGSDAGSAYVFVRSGTTWTQQTKLVPADAAGSDYFGRSVTLSGDTALVGAPYDDCASGTDAGSAYVFRLTTCGTAVAYGSGCAGSGGFVPALALSGCPAPNQTVQLTLSQGLGGSLALFLFGAGQGSLPIGGGCTFLLNPLLPLQFILPLGGTGPGNGSIVVSGVVPASAGGLTFAMQAAVQDPASALGFTLTNGVFIQVAP